MYTATNQNSSYLDFIDHVLIEEAVVEEPGDQVSVEVEVPGQVRVVDPQRAPL